MENTSYAHYVRIIEDKVRYYFTYALQGLFLGFIFVSQLCLTPFLYIINWSFKLLSYFVKGVSLLFTLIFTGVDGVMKKIGRHYHANEINYAVLKENGQYLKLEGESLEAVLVCQLYDYTIRKFMTMGGIDREFNVAEIQFSNIKGLEYVKEKLGVKKVMGLSNKKKKINRVKQLNSQIQFKHTKYADDEQLDLPVDVFLLFNSFKEQQSIGNYVDLIRIFGFIKKNMNKNGYAVFGRYLDSEGESAVFQELFEGLGFRIHLQEDITPNIEHAEKMLRKIHKNRKVVWAFWTIKQYVKNLLEKDSPICKMLKGIWIVIKRLARRINTQPRYIVYILEKK